MHIFVVWSQNYLNREQITNRVGGIREHMLLCPDLPRMSPGAGEGWAGCASDSIPGRQTKEKGTFDASVRGHERIAGFQHGDL
ncbi:hypothetical protein C8Q77DRAFT_570581 [Trametes polyzona]|nr:hypothetical protein C8Q77DRAFT_570581 [Trametes polyzona]